MSYNVSLEEVKREIGQVMHPAINSTLVELGMIKEVALNGNQVTINLSLPCTQVPEFIKNQLANSLREAAGRAGAEAKIEITVMSEEARQTFLSIEQNNWKGFE